MKLLILLLLTSSCAMIDKTSERSYRSYVDGPLPDQVSIDDVKENLSRWKKVPGIGWVHAQLITPAYIYLVNREKKTFQYANNSEMTRRLNQEIDFLYRYQSCFTITVETQNPNALDFNFWKAYISYGQFNILTAKVKDTTDEIEGHPYVSSPSLENERAYATVCTDDKMDLDAEFTLVLVPNYRPALPKVRLTWLESQWDPYFKKWWMSRNRWVHKRSKDPSPDKNLNQNKKLNLIKRKESTVK
jgi:hypothetical protein